MADQKLPSPFLPLLSIAFSLLFIPVTLPVRPPDHGDRLPVLELLSLALPLQGTRHLLFSKKLPPPLHAPAHSHFPERPLRPGPATAPILPQHPVLLPAMSTYSHTSCLSPSTEEPPRQGPGCFAGSTPGTGAGSSEHIPPIRRLRAAVSLPQVPDIQAVTNTCSCFSKEGRIGGKKVGRRGTKQSE